MIKKIIPTALLAIVVTASSVSQAAAENLKVATINTQKVLLGYWKMDVLNDEFKKDEVSIREENDSKLADIKKRTAEIQELRKQLGDPNLPQSKLKELNQRYKISFNRLKNLDMTRRQYIEGKVKALRLEKAKQQNEMLKDVQDLISQVAAEKGYDFIFDKGEKIGVVLFAKKSFDISDDILAKLNEGRAEKKPAAPAAP